MKGDNCSLRNCNKIAIGYYSSLSYGFNVCLEHAPKELIGLNPGETITKGQYQYHKY